MTKAAFEVDDEFRQLWADGASSADPAHKYGTTPGNVNKRAERDGLPGRPVGKTRQRPKTGPHTRKQAAVRRDGKKPKPAPTVEEIAHKLRCAAAESDQPADPCPIERQAEIIKTGGNLSQIGTLAAKWRVPERHVLCKYHKLTGSA